MQYIYNYNKRIQDEAMRFVRPLFDYIGFNLFAYMRHYHGNKYFLYVSDPNVFCTIYPHVNDDDYTVFSIKPKLNEKKIILNDYSFQSNPWVSLLKEQNYCNGLSIYNQTHEDYVDGWFFYTNQKDSNISNIYTNHFDLIDKFIVYFQETTKYLLDVNNPKNHSEYRHNVSLNLKNTNDFTPEDFTNFLEAINIKKHSLSLQEKEIHCTNNELQIIKFIAQGFSAKEIGYLLEKSPRTVETQIYNLKEKMNMPSTQKIINCFNNSIYRNFKF